MAHDSQKHFCSSVRDKFPDKFKDCSALDVGSLDINGNNRYLFSGNFTYVGVDIGPGNNVDVISKGHEYHPGIQYDIVVSTECFEHDPFWKETLQNCADLTKSGGVFLFTCAYYNREEHGTLRTNTVCAAPHVVALFGDYYRNLGPKEVYEALDVEKIFSAYECIPGGSEGRGGSDMWFWGLKK